MVWRNEETGRRFVFEAPHTLEGPDVVVVPFPAVALRKPQADGTVIHDANPVVLIVAEGDLDELLVRAHGIQPASILIVHNEKETAVKVAEILCAKGDTVLMHTIGEAYVKIGETPLAVADVPAEDDPEIQDKTETEEGSAEQESKPDPAGRGKKPAVPKPSADK
ncbi:hypothetical protein [Tannerella forsythia]|uniref:Uncharacterized protein n=1 Tax=Tannerella forsythia TaxID=28112 RepID=A0A2A6EAC5_TANFO|nr:hypothetical protein [Tannerella forsythia]PDP44704.1 hypothetical protein CLI86_02170 [Tannerella forsythia]